jgi:hypothetical protein
MTPTEKVALAMAWYDSGLEDRAAFQTLMESILEQPPQRTEQEPVAYLVLFEGAGKLLEFTKGNYLHGAKVEHIPLYTAPPQRTEQNFCSRCGKRTPDLITIHTCTPPKD